MIDARTAGTADDAYAARILNRIDRSAAHRADREERVWDGPWGPYSDGTIPPNSAAGFGAGFALPMVAEDEALRHGTVLACISLLCDTVITTPLRAYREGRNGAPEQIDPPKIIAQPSAELYDFDFYHQTAESLIGAGNSCLSVLERDKLGYPTTLAPLHPDTIEFRRENGRKVAKVYGSYVRSAETLTCTGATPDLIHIPAFTVPGALRGLNRLQKAMVTIYSGLAAERYGARWFTDSANPSGVLQSKDPVGKEATEETQRNWIQTHGGRRLPAVLNGFEWKPISISPEESQFLQTQNWSTMQIARWWRCPPHLVGAVDKSTSWGSGIEEQTLGYLTYGVMPYHLRLERVWTTMMPKGQWAAFDVDGLLRGRTLDRYMAYVHARNAGWMSVNEIRKEEGRPPVDGGDSYMQPLNMGPLGTNPADKPTPPPPDPEA